MTEQDDEQAWFEPKRIGVGAGLPKRWPGWLLVLGYVGLMLFAGWISRSEQPRDLLLALLLGVAATAAFLLIASRTTRGGWRWRSRDDAGGRR